MRLITLFLTVTALACISSAVQYPGLNIAVRRDLLREISDKVMPAFISNYKPVYMNKVFKFLFLEITDITFLGLSLPSASLKGRFEQNDLVLWSNNVGVKLTAKVNIDLPLFHKTINVKMSCKDSGMFQRMTIENKNGYPSPNLKSVEFEIGSFDLEMDGYLLPYISTAITKVFNLELLKPIVNFIADITKGIMVKMTNEIFLNHMMDNFDEVLGMPYKLDLNFARTPLLTSDFAALQFNGTVYKTNTQPEYPEIPSDVEMPEYDTTAEGKFQIFMSEYLFNSGIYAAWKDGQFKAIVSTKSLDNVEGLKINLDWLKKYIQPFIGMLGNQTDMLIELDCLKPPQVKLTNDTFRTMANLSITLALMMNNTRFQVFTAETPYDIETKFYSTNLTLNLNDPKVKMGNLSALSIVSSNVGDIVDLFKLQELVDKMVSRVLAHMNITSSVREMPRLLNLNMTTVEISIYDGYMQVNANPDFVTFERNYEVDFAQFDKDEIEQPAQEPEVIVLDAKGYDELLEMF